MRKRIDTLVIGAGSIGVCSAYFLASKGRQVTVIDQNDVGAACSYGNAGIIAVSHIVPLAAPGVLTQGFKWMLDPEGPFYIKPRIDSALFSWLWRFALACRKERMLRGMSLLNGLAHASLPLYENFAAMNGLGFHFKKKGSLVIYRDAKHFEAEVREAETVKPYGISSKVLNQTDIHQIEPRLHPSVVGGVHYQDDSHLNPHEFVTGLASHAERKGVTFQTSTEVLDFETWNGTITKVNTTRGDFAADEVILTAGSWSPGLAKRLQLSLPIQPAKGYSLTFKSSNLDDSFPMRLGEARVIVTPMGGIVRFAGTLELSGLDLSINQRRVRAVRSAVQEYVVGLENLELLEIWRGLRPLTPDGLPIIGRSRRWENLTIATGHGMQGIALGPITGKLVAELTCRETPSVDIAGLGEERFQ